ncbi:hypothetical protein GINT2_000998 [Glugoides intestinalis]
MFNRIPVYVKIVNECVEINDFSTELDAQGTFKVKSISKNYFSMLVEAILNNEDPLEIINKYVPDIKGLLYISITVDKESSSTANYFIYEKGMGDDKFDVECKKVLNLLKEMLLCNSKREKTSYGIFNKVIAMLEPSKDQADLYFIEKDYKNALLEYNRLYKSYPELSRRMTEVCKATLGNKLSAEPLALDLLLFYRMYSELIELSWKLPFDAQLAVQYYVASSDIDRKHRIIYFFICYENFRMINEIEKAEMCYGKLIGLLETAVLNDLTNQYFLYECIGTISEYKKC